MPAVVLATRPLGEADLLVVLLTARAGKIRAAARNARKSRRRFPGGLPGGAMGRATVSPGRGGLWRLDAFASVREVSGLGRDLGKFAYVAYVCELTDALVTEPEPDPRRFAALVEAIESTLEQGADPGILRRFELRLLDTLGLLPALRHCCVCGDDVPLPAEHDRAVSVAYSAERGGVLCPLHAGVGETISSTVLIRAFDLLQGPDPERSRAGLAAAPADQRQELRDLSTTVIRGQLRRPLRSLQFFGAIDRGADG